MNKNRSVLTQEQKVKMSNYEELEKSKKKNHYFIAGCFAIGFFYSFSNTPITSNISLLISASNSFFDGLIK